MEKKEKIVDMRKPMIEYGEWLSSLPYVLHVLEHVSAHVLSMCLGMPGIFIRVYSCRALPLTQENTRQALPYVTFQQDSSIYQAWGDFSGVVSWISFEVYGEIMYEILMAAQMVCLNLFYMDVTVLSLKSVV